MSWIIGGIGFILLALIAGAIRYIGSHLAKKAHNRYLEKKGDDESL